MMNDDAGSQTSKSASRDHSDSVSCGSLPRSRSLPSFMSMKNHHIDNQGKASLCHFKRTHSYSDNEEGRLHRPVQDRDSICAIFISTAIKKSKKERHKTV